MFRQVLIASTLVLAGLGVSAAPAEAIPIGGYQNVYAYFSDAAHTNFIGERWTGCPGNPAGSWGVTSGYVYHYTLEC
ncbi:hypothetical protein Lfu02_09860 [Longispora fulva]|uniref:Secreted protein n=1 Tax=Longispora fulva TaxID=619741 RepID=A0A8J7GQM4_9ACTN|nr:DUF6289 family protein [Longispora fulva]MBG6135151.1 hypothetical protein [Longispora fulva]GIG56614.1 hypothetical protein Lfu02_09860 [Longispora fulva]